MSQRIEKINDLIRDNLAKIIQKELSLSQGVFVSITKVDTSTDLRYARVLVSVFPEERRDYGLKTLTKEIWRIQKELNDRLACKPLPKISFVSDESGKKSDDLEKIFKQIRQERQTQAEDKE